jgi:hypothetical protein
MAKYVKKTLSWTPSNSLDVVSHKVYAKFGGAQPDYLSPNIDIPLPAASVELPFPGMTLDDGTYIFGISAVDDFGNESDLVFLPAELDFLAPNPPTNLSIG